MVSTLQEFHVSKMCFSRQQNLQIEKGQIPLKVCFKFCSSIMVEIFVFSPNLFQTQITCEPVPAAVKLAAYNAFQETNDLFLPSNKTIFITDNTKKKMISKVQNDTQLAKITCIGYVCQV